MGRVTRKGLGPVASAAVFGAKAGSFEGPFKVGKEFQVLRVIELHPAILDEGTRRIVEDRMFEDWLSEAREKATVEIPLFDAAPEAVEA